MEKDISINTQKVKIMLEPPIRYAVYSASRLAMILGNADEDVWNWFYSNHIQIYYNEPATINGKYDHILQFVSFKNRSHTFFLEENKISDANSDYQKTELVEQCKIWLEKGYYVQPYLDVSKLKNTQYDGTGIISHTLFIVAYDKDSELFTILDYDKNRIYTLIDIKEEDLYEGFLSEHIERELVRKQLAKEYFIMLYKFHQNKFEFDRKTVANKIQDYVNGSCDNSVKLSPSCASVDNITFGINIYDSLINYLHIHREHDIDERAFRALVEHKKVMLNRLEYINQNACPISKDLIDQYREISRKVEIIFFKVIQYNLTLRKQVLDFICDNLKIIKEKEMNILTEVINEMR